MTKNMLKNQRFRQNGEGRKGPRGPKGPKGLNEQTNTQTAKKQTNTQTHKHTDTQTNTQTQNTQTRTTHNFNFTKTPNPPNPPGRQTDGARNIAAAPQVPLSPLKVLFGPLPPFSFLFFEGKEVIVGDNGFV